MREHSRGVVPATLEVLGVVAGCYQSEKTMTKELKIHLSQFLLRFFALRWRSKNFHSDRDTPPLAYPNICETAVCRWEVV